MRRRRKETRGLEGSGEEESEGREGGREDGETERRSHWR